MQRFRAFRRDESGAVTADWVAITAAIAVLTITTVYSIRSYTVSLGPAISAEIDRQMR